MVSGSYVGSTHVGMFERNSTLDLYLTVPSRYGYLYVEFLNPIIFPIPKRYGIWLDNDNDVKYSVLDGMTLSYNSTHLDPSLVKIDRVYEEFYRGVTYFLQYNLTEIRNSTLVAI